VGGPHLYPSKCRSVVTAVRSWQSDIVTERDRDSRVVSD